MACFTAPLTEAVVTTAIEKAIEIKAMNEAEATQTDIEEIKANHPVLGKIKWLNNMLWGGTALLAFEHVWHGEVVPFFPFLTAAANPAEATQMLHEIATTGVTMAVAVTAVWGVMVAVSTSLEKKAALKKTQE